MLEEVARQGIPALVNSPGLADSYRALGSPAVAFTPAVDTERFRPPPTRPAGPRADRVLRAADDPAQRLRAGLETLRRVKERHGDAVQIVCAGEDWTPGPVRHGRRARERRAAARASTQVAELYRSCHVGLVFMLSRHPSYQPLEFMASGAVTVTNANPHTGGCSSTSANALLSPPVPALVADQISRLVEDPALRDRLARGRARDRRGAGLGARVRARCGRR